MAAVAEKVRNMNDFVGGRDPKAAAKRLREQESWYAVREEARAFMTSGDWEGAEGRHFMALHAILFEQVYGVACTEVSGPGRMLAAKLASDLLEARFGGDPGKLAAYVRWVWEREVGREKWRRENGRDGSTLSFRWVLNEGRTLDEYALAMARRRGR